MPRNKLDQSPATQTQIPAPNYNDVNILPPVALSSLSAPQPFISDRWMTVNNLKGNYPRISLLGLMTSQRYSESVQSNLARRPVRWGPLATLCCSGIWQGAEELTLIVVDLTIGKTRLSCRCQWRWAEWDACADSGCFWLGALLRYVWNTVRWMSMARVNSDSCFFFFLMIVAFLSFHFC